MMLRLCWLCALLLAMAVNAAPRGAAADVPPVLVMRVEGAIGPVTADQVRQVLDRAASQRAQLVVLQLDTPGGLDGAMRSIIQAILASPTPVASYVWPPGARAASAGTYLLYASHVAAMAPATNLGAATPVAIGLPPLGPAKAPASPPAGAASMPDGHGDTMNAKRINDASAYIRGLAQLRGRDAVWAEQAVRESVGLAASEALSRKVIDLVAADLADLLRQLDGRELVAGAPGAAPVKLNTAHAPVIVVEPDWRLRLLAVISDPSVALVLMMLGIYGLLFEFMNPGFVAPGVIGGLSLLVGMWALQMLPINYAGVALILLGIAFFVAEAFVPSYGALGLGGIAAFALGALLLIDGDLPGFHISRALIAGLTLVSAVFVIGITRMAGKARARPVAHGLERLVGASAEVIEFGGGEGWAVVGGERWRVISGQNLRAGQRVRVTRAEGLRLEVSPIAALASPGEGST